MQDYKILHGSDRYQLEHTVKSHLQENPQWILHGYPFIFNNLICQAVIRIVH